MREPQRARSRHMQMAEALTIQYLNMFGFRSGVGIGAVDVAYCIAASASASVLPLDDLSAVDVYLKFYYQSLIEGFLHFRVFQNEVEARAALPENVFTTQFCNAFIDLARVVIADHWKCVTPETLQAREGKLSFNAYNKCGRMAKWMVALTDQYLAS